MSSDSLVQLTLRSRTDGPSETVVLPARHIDPATWGQAAGVTVCDPPPKSDGQPGVFMLQIHDVLAETGHLEIAAALGEVGRYRALSQRLMVAVVGALLLRDGLLLVDPESAHREVCAALNRLIDLALADLS